MSPQHVVVTLLASLSLGLPSYAAAGVSAAPSASAGEKSTWVRRIREVRGDLADAEARYAEAVQAYGSMRHRRNERGEAKADIVAEQEAAREDLSRASSRLDELLEEARRAGVPPGWIREAMGETPSAPEH